MQISLSTGENHQIVSIAGQINRFSAGDLYDALVALTVEGEKDLVIDLSGVTQLTCAGMRGIVVAATLLHRVGGRMRLSGADRSIEDFLHGRGYEHLLTFDRTKEESLEALGARTRTLLFEAPFP